MKTTLLDDYLQNCLDGQEMVPAFRRMFEVIKETTPVTYLWRDGALGEPLPAEVLHWHDPAFLLWTPNGFMDTADGHHRFAVDVDNTYDDKQFASWFNRTWDLEGVLVFTRPGYARFDTIPLARQIGGPLILADVQLSYELTPDGWAWNYATVGPNNWYFHNWFKNELSEEDQAKVDENVMLLGNTVSCYLGGFWQHQQTDGEWFVKPPKLAKVKLNKKGQIRKVIKPGTLGYKEWRTNGES